MSSFVYDANGNRVKGYDNGINFNAQFDVQDRLVKFNQTTFTYNANGFVTSKTVAGIGTSTYTYDSMGNLLRVQLPTNDVRYEVDPKGRRTLVNQFSSTFKTRYVWDEQLRVIAELDSSGSLVKKYVYVDEVNSPEYMIYSGKKYLFIKDHRGSIVQVVDSETGEIKQKMKYSEWGSVMDDSNPGFQPFGFASGLYDNLTKLYRFGARDYDPEIGRWLSKDPIDFEGNDTNLYGYVLQDPINFIDTEGESRSFVSTPGLGREFVGGGGLALPILAGKILETLYGDENEVEIPSDIQQVTEDSIITENRCENSRGGDKEHTKNKRKSNLEKHQKGRARNQKDKRGEKGDSRRPYRRK